MTKNEAITIIEKMNLSNNDEQQIIDIIFDVDFESYVLGYDDGYSEARADYW